MAEIRSCNMINYSNRKADGQSNLVKDIYQGQSGATKEQLMVVACYHLAGATWHPAGATWHPAVATCDHPLNKATQHRLVLYHHQSPP